MTGSLPPARPETAAPRVLFVDDNADLTTLMELLLSDRGCEVASAADGPAALEVAARLRPHVVFLDLHLPGMDGIELARRLLAASPDPLPVLVVLSGYVDTEIEARAKAAGVSAVLEKVGDVDALERALFAFLPAASDAS